MAMFLPVAAEAAEGAAAGGAAAEGASASGSSGLVGRVLSGLQFGLGGKKSSGGGGSPAPAKLSTTEAGAGGS